MGTEEEAEAHGWQQRQGKEQILSLSTVRTALCNFTVNDAGNIDKECVAYAINAGYV